ncbi:MAG TPA: MFS transporter [Hyphomonadaceae bacterium]|jgi:MFS family permease|nr:MFS transporter [Hyphomonadaceae bacterium]
MEKIIAERSYGWVIVAAGGLIGCVAAGAMFALAVYLQPIALNTGWSRAEISVAMTLVFIVMGVSGFAWGMASDRFGARPVVMTGAVLLSLGLMLASQASSALMFQLAYGVLVGAAGGAFFAPIMATTTLWFEKNLGLAVSLVSAGMGMAPLTLSPLTAVLIDSHGWRTAMFIVSILVLAVIIPAAFFIRRPVKPAAAPRAANAGPAPEQGSLLSALKSPHFIAIAIAYFFCCGAHSGPIFHTISYAEMCGISSLAAVSIYSVEGLSGLGGRLLLGLAADRFGAKRILIVGLAVQAVVIAGYTQVNQLGQFYAMAVVLGAAYGGVMPLYAMLARGYFKPEIMGGVLGAAVMASSLGMSFGPVAGGWLFDTFGNYAWMYLGSAAAGLAAFIIAFSFPKPKFNVGQAQAA